MDVGAPFILALLFAIKMLPKNCRAEAEYMIFRGFDPMDWINPNKPNATNNASTVDITNAASDAVDTTATTTPTTNFADYKLNWLETTAWSSENTRDSLSTLMNWFETTPSVPKIRTHSKCPEEETPSNIGPYEVPSQRDLVLLTMKTLRRLFASYHQKAMLFLDDIHRVITATDKVAPTCRGNRVAYRKCVERISDKCEGITKSLISNLEKQRQDVLAFSQDTICNIQAMKEDPVKLIKILASEEASLKFALPGFLRLLSTCNIYCSSNASEAEANALEIKSATNDMVIKHFLARNNYKRLLKPGSARVKIPIPRRKLNV